MLKKLLFLLILAPIFTAKSQSIQSIGIEQLQQKIDFQQAPVVIVNFWATWCKPCVLELPYFEQVNKNYSSRQVKVLLVSLDPLTGSSDRVPRFIKKNRIQTEVCLLNAGSAGDWIEKIDKEWSGAIPATLILNQKTDKRVFIERELQPDELEQHIRAIL